MSKRALEVGLLIATFAILGGCAAPTGDETAEQGGAATAGPGASKQALVGGPEQGLVEKYVGCYDIVSNILAPGVPADTSSWGPSDRAKVLCTDDAGVGPSDYKINNGLGWGWEYQTAGGDLAGVAGGNVMLADPACAGCVEVHHVWETAVQKLRPVGDKLVVTFEGRSIGEGPEKLKLERTVTLAKRAPVAKPTGSIFVADPSTKAKYQTIEFRTDKDVARTGVAKSTYVQRGKAISIYSPTVLGERYALTDGGKTLKEFDTGETYRLRGAK
jgi:hypothetical protein